MSRLSKKQLAVVEDLFAGELDEASVLAKHKVSRKLYEKWLADERFTEAFNKLIARAHRQGLLIIARCVPLAASKLVQLTDSDSPETARKACLDILSNPAMDPSPAGPRDCGARYGSGVPADARVTGDETQATSAGLSPETASRLLAALAEIQVEPGTKEEG
jgi:hypothetical protein